MISAFRGHPTSGPHPRCRQQILNYRVLESRPLVLLAATEQGWSLYGDAWVDAHDLARAATECLSQPLREAANVITDHFIWRDFYAELVQLIGSGRPIEHKALDTITSEELPNKAFYT